jgi:hypothetical protein
VVIFLLNLLAGCSNPAQPTMQFTPPARASSSTITPSKSPIPYSSQTPMMEITPLPSATFTLPPTATCTPYPPTLEPGQVEQAIEELMQRNGDCSQPCFWGIIPGVTSVDKAKSIFALLGIGLQPVRNDPLHKHLYTYWVDDGMLFGVNILTLLSAN